MVQGNTYGLSKEILVELDSMYGIEIARDNFFSSELAQKMVEITGRINREISVYVNRYGNVVDVSVGEAGQVALPYLRLRRSEDRLSGIRCIHTHPGGTGQLSRVDLSSLRDLKFDAMAAIGVEERRFKNAYIAMLNPSGCKGEFTIFGPLDIENFCGKALIAEIMERDRKILHQQTRLIKKAEEERAVLVGLDIHGEGMDSIEELEQLAKTAGAYVVSKVTQNRKEPDTATYIGRGKAEELSLACRSLNANLVIFDDELSASQIRNLEDIIGVRVIDRTALILDIFAQRATSREGKLQVELAQLKYRLPRLVGMGIDLSRLGGGIGTRGPGEKKLETDRRHIRRRIKDIEDQLKKVRDRRQALRSRREKNKIPVVALVGYTNAGKSTLLNALSGSNVLVEDKLFATLDPVSRGVTLENNQEILLVDTVGFISKLPHDLVEAFKSTLEEAVYADLILHVVDASSPNHHKQMNVVNKVLGSLGAAQPVITVFNKMDKVMDKSFIAHARPAVYISAARKQGLDDLLRAIAGTLPKQSHKIALLIPYKSANVVSALHNQGRVINEEYRPDGVYMEIYLDDAGCKRFKEFKINT